MIGSENRAKLNAIAEDLTPAQYLDAIWRKRNNAYKQTRSTGKWPIQRPDGWAEKERAKLKVKRDADARRLQDLVNLQGIQGNYYANNQMPPGIGLQYSASTLFDIMGNIIR